MPYAKYRREKLALPNWLRKAFGLSVNPSPQRPQITMPAPVIIPQPRDFR